MFLAPYHLELICLPWKRSDVEARLEEMRQLISMRNGGQSTPTKRRGGTPSASPSKKGTNGLLDGIVAGAEQSLGKVLSAHETMQDCLDLFAARWRQVCLTVSTERLIEPRIRGQRRSRRLELSSRAPRDSANC